MHCLNSRGLLLLSETLKAKWAVLYENENQILSAPTKSYLLIKHENVNNTKIILILRNSNAWNSKKRLALLLFAFFQTYFYRALLKFDLCEKHTNIAKN